MPPEPESTVLPPRPFDDSLKRAIAADPAPFGPLLDHARSQVQNLVAGVVGSGGGQAARAGGVSAVASGILGQLSGVGGGLLGGLTGPALGGIIGSCFPDPPSPTMLPDFTKGGCFPGSATGT